MRAAIVALIIDVQLTQRGVHAYIAAPLSSLEQHRHTRRRWPYLYKSPWHSVTVNHRLLILFGATTVMQATGDQLFREDWQFLPC